MKVEKSNCNSQHGASCIDISNKFFDLAISFLESELFAENGAQSHKNSKAQRNHKIVIKRKTVAKI